MTTPQNLRYLATFLALKAGEVNDDLELVLHLATDDERAQAAAYTAVAVGLAYKFRAAADRLSAGAASRPRRARSRRPTQSCEPRPSSCTPSSPTPPVWWT